MRTKKTLETKNIPPRLSATIGIRLDCGVLVFASSESSAHRYKNFRLLIDIERKDSVIAKGVKGYCRSVKVTKGAPAKTYFLYSAFIPLSGTYSLQEDVDYIATFRGLIVSFRARTLNASNVEHKNLLSLFAEYREPLVRLLPVSIGESHTFSQAFAHFNLAALQRGRWLLSRKEIEQLVMEKKSSLAISRLVPFVTSWPPQAEAEDILGNILFYLLPDSRRLGGHIPSIKNLVAQILLNEFTSRQLYLELISSNTREYKRGLR